MDKTKIIILAAIGVLLVGVIVVIVLNPFKQAAPAPVTLEFWSVFDDSSVYRPLIQEYQALNPHVTINYYKKESVSYENELVNVLAAGRGPDIFSIHNTWLPKHQDKLASLGGDAVTPARYNEVFVDVAGQDFIAGGQIYAFPLSVDSLALFYNKDLFNSAGIASPPKTWTEFNAAVEKLVRRDAQNNVLRAGATLGTAKNVNRSTDILMALMLQSGAKMVDVSGGQATFDQDVAAAGSGSFNPGLQALIFYTNFAKPGLKVYTWNALQHYSLDAFVEGQAAMTLNYAYQAPVIAARSPHLNFGVTPLPQISLTTAKATFANYWAQAVSKSSPNQAEAWKFVIWLSSQEGSRKYLAATQKPASRRDLIDEQKNNANLTVFAQQALYAKSWREADNLAIETIFADMIESVVSGKAQPESALRQAAGQVTELMRRK